MITNMYDFDLVEDKPAAFIIRDQVLESPQTDVTFNLANIFILGSRNSIILVAL